jgi:hypothetical protein
VDTGSDPDHCGTCDSPCGDDEVCSSGTCALSCPGSQVACDGGCIDPDNDPDFCGATGDCTGDDVGTACEDDEACVAGGCMQLDPCETHVPSGTPGVTVSSVSATAVEGGDPVHYTVVLDTAPCANVVVAVTPDAQVTADPSTLVFIPDNWDEPQTVTVTAVHDFSVEGSHTGSVDHDASSLDPDYGAAAIDDATVDVADRAHLEHVTVPLSGTGSNADSVAWGVSNDGRYVVFQSDATNLVVNDSGSHSDTFVRDMTTKVTTRLSEGEDAEGDGDSTRAAISDDGDRIVFFSWATNLVTDSISGSGEIYLYSQSEGTISLVSAQCVSCNTEISAGGFSISGDGAFVAYSTRRQLLDPDGDGEFDVFLYDVEDDSITLESLNSSDENGDFYWGSNNFDPTLSADGQFVGFTSAAHNLDTPEITVQNFHSYVKDTDTRTLTRVSKHSGGDTNCDGTYHTSSSSTPHITASGDLAVFHSGCTFTLTAGETEDTNSAQDVFMRDIAAQTTMRLSVSSAGDEANAASRLMGISDDGRYVLFSSDATNLVAGDTNEARDLFVRDTVDDTTIRVSLDAMYEEIPGGVGEQQAWISRNGAWVVFTTNDDLLPTDDNTDIADVYLVQLH